MKAIEYQQHRKSGASCALVQRYVPHFAVVRRSPPYCAVVCRHRAVSCRLVPRRKSCQNRGAEGTEASDAVATQAPVLCRSPPFCAALCRHLCHIAVVCRKSMWSKTPRYTQAGLEAGSRSLCLPRRWHSTTSEAFLQALLDRGERAVVQPVEDVLLQARIQRQPLVRAGRARLRLAHELVGGEVDGVIYGTRYSTIHGPMNGTKNKNRSGALSGMVPYMVNISYHAGPVSGTRNVNCSGALLIRPERSFHNL